jgi:hypothetical protein
MEEVDEVELVVDRVAALTWGWRTERAWGRPRVAGNAVADALLPHHAVGRAAYDIELGGVTIPADTIVGQHRLG